MVYAGWLVVSRMLGTCCSSDGSAVLALFISGLKIVLGMTEISSWIFLMTVDRL